MTKKEKLDVRGKSYQARDLALDALRVMKGKERRSVSDVNRLRLLEEVVNSLDLVAFGL